jgi:glycosyltransferase involved in cell wall biosynthesis
MVDRSLLRQSLQRHVLSIDSLSTDSRREPDPEPESGASSVHTSASPASSRSSKGALDVTLLSLAGTSYYISSFANTLAATVGVGTVRVLVPSYSPETETLDRDRVDLIELGVADSVARSMLAAANPRFLRRLLRLIDVGESDVLHIINEMRVPFYFSSLVRARADQPVVLTVHEPDPYMPTRLRSAILNPIQRQNLRALARYVDRFVVHGDVLERKLSRSAPEERIAVVPHGSFAEYFTRHLPQARDPTDEEVTDILFFGRLAPGKGLPYLVRAGRALALELPDLTITIAGPPAENVSFDGLDPSLFDVHARRVPEAEAAGLFDRAAVVAMPYTNASASGIISIAGGFETPVVASAVGTFPEVIDHGETGLLVPPRDVDALAASLEELLSDPTERARMGARLGRVQERTCSWEVVVDDTLDVYRNALR